MTLHRIVDAVDDWLEETLHERHDERRTSTRRPRSPARARVLRARDELRQAAAGVLFLRNKLEAEQTERRVRMARACHALLRAVREDDDATARPLLDYRDVLRDRIEHAEAELAGLRNQAADAVSGLARISRTLARIDRAEAGEAPAPAAARRHRTRPRR